MPDDEQTPVASEAQTEEPSAQAAPASADQPEASAAAPVEQPQPKQRDRYREMGRRLAEAEKLALSTARENQELKERLQRFDQFVTQSQQAAFEQQLSQLPPEEQTIVLARRLREVQAQVNRPAAAPAPQVQPDTANEAMRIIQDANIAFGLEDDGLNGSEPELHYSLHPTRDSFVKAAYRLAQARANGTEEEEVATKKTETTKPQAQESVSDVVAKEMAKLRQELGIGRPNAAVPAGSAKGSAEISDLNTIAARNDLGPKARRELLKKAGVA